MPAFSLSKNSWISSMPRFFRSSMASAALLATPLVWLTPCTDGYWPVNRVARLGAQAVLPA